MNHNNELTEALAKILFNAIKEDRDLTSQETEYFDLLLDRALNIP